MKEVHYNLDDQINLERIQNSNSLCSIKNVVSFMEECAIIILIKGGATKEKN